MTGLPRSALMMEAGHRPWTHRFDGVIVGGWWRVLTQVEAVVAEPGWSVVTNKKKSKPKKEEGGGDTEGAASS